MSESKKRYLYLVTCVVCGKKEQKCHPTQTCSRRCMGLLAKAKTKERAPLGICPVCNAEKPLLYIVYGERVCCRKCRNTQSSRFYNRKIGKHFEPEVRKCDECGKEYLAKQPQQRCCSLVCIHRLHEKPSDKRRQLSKEAHSRNRERYEKGIECCALCGVKYEAIITPSELEMHFGCRQAKFHVDHIVPKSNGGSSDSNNIRHLCWFCNIARKDLSQEYDTAIAAAGKAFWDEMTKLTNKEHNL